MRRFLLFLFLNLSFANTICFADIPKQMMAVVEEIAGYVDFYDLEDGKSLGGVRVGFLPHEIEIDKDQRTAYISNFGIKDYDDNIGRAGTSISVLDIPTRTEKFRFFTFDPTLRNDYAVIDKAPHGIKLRPPLYNDLYVNVEAGKQMLIYDLHLKKMKGRFAINANTHNFVFSPDGKIIWLMAGADGVIRVNADNGEVTGSLKFTTPVRGLKYTPDAKQLMASCVNEIHLIDPVNFSVSKTFKNLGVGQILYSDMTPDKKYIVAPAAFDNQVIIIETASGKVIKRIVTGLNPITVKITPDGYYAYVSNATDQHVSKIDLHTFAMTKILTKAGSNTIVFVPFSLPDQAQSLTLGVALPLSGKDGPKGRDMMRGYEFWKSMVNDAGGIWINNNVYQIKTVYLDTQSNASNVHQLTKNLIENFHVQVMLSTYGEAGYKIESQTANQYQIPITPPQSNQNPWMPNEIAAGNDYFVTTKDFDQQFYAQYSIKASTYSASATALGIILQKALSEANSVDYKVLTKVISSNRFNVFSQY